MGIKGINFDWARSITGNCVAVEELNSEFCLEGYCLQESLDTPGVFTCV
jgi:hypothetical protein